MHFLSPDKKVEGLGKINRLFLFRLNSALLWCPAWCNLLITLSWYLKYRWSFFASFFLCQTHNKQWFYIYYYTIRQQPMLVLSFSIITIETMYLVIILYLEFFSSSHRNQVCSRYKIRFVYRKRRNEKERNKCIGIEMERERKRKRKNKIWRQRDS